MKHLGDITKINGYEIEPVDVITGGSPCQDLSVAGKRAGLAGKRSGLFMEQIRVIKEMRQHERDNGRSGIDVRPRFMVWENVPGAFSSSGGADFAAVLEETIRIAEPKAPPVNVPSGGWNTWGQYRDVDGRWSVAWRTLDAQYWGVPQRRRRIALVADFGGDSAGEILFKRGGLHRDSKESRAPRQETTVYTGAGIETGGNVGVLAFHLTQDPITGSISPCLSGGNNKSGQCVCGIVSMATQQGGAEIRRDDKCPTITASAGLSGNNQPVVCYPRIAKTITARYDGSPQPDKGNGASIVVCTAGFKAGNGAKAGGIGFAEELAPTLSAAASGTYRVPAICIQGDIARGARHGQNGAGIRDDDVSYTLNTLNTLDIPAVFDARGKGSGNIAPTINASGESHASDYTAICIGNGQANQNIGEIANSLSCMHDQQCIMTAHSLRGRPNASLREDSDTYIPQGQVVRRLTPLECERLQGYPDRWTDIGDWTDCNGKNRKAADGPRYKALGNSIALPPWRFVLAGISEHLLPDATLGSLFDGIGGFPLIWEELHGEGTARWVSEIESFPIAVTRVRFKEEI